MTDATIIAGLLGFMFGVLVSASIAACAVLCCSKSDER